MVNPRFMMTPYMVGSLVVMLAVFLLGLAVLPLKVLWIHLAHYPFFFSAMFACALIAHPGVLALFLSPKRMQRLVGVEHIRDFFLLLVLVIFFIELGDIYVQTTFVFAADLPYVDALLLAGDRALGLDWVAYLDWVYSQPWLIPIYYSWYLSLGSVGLGVTLFFIAFKRLDRLFYFIHTFWLSAFVCITIGAFFPAVGAATYLLPDMSAYPLLVNYPGTNFVPVMETLRDLSQPVTIDASRMNGVVSLPSFHTAGAMAIAFALHQTRLWPLGWIYALGVIAATPILGAHYFTDVVAGAVVALAMSWWGERMLARRWAKFFPGRALPARKPAPNAQGVQSAA